MVYVSIQVLVVKLILSGIVEFELLRKVLLLSVSNLIMLLWLFKVLRVSSVILGLVYSIMLHSIAEVCCKDEMSILEFQAFFLRKELFFIVLTYSIGLFIHIKHIVYGILANILFITLAAILKSDASPMGGYIFFIWLTLCCGVMGYLVYDLLGKMNAKLVKANDKISLQNIELQNVNRSKDELFRILGHDLKTPYAQMEGLLEWMTDLDNETERKQVLELMKQSAKKGHELLSSLLLWATVQTEEQTLEKGNIELLNIVEETEKFYSMNLFRKDLRLEHNIMDSMTVTSNEDMLKTVLRNLVGNAIKYSNRNSVISLLTEPTNGRLKIAVIDRGMGMTQDQIENLLKNEKNTSKPGTEKETGTGFGIGISKKMLQKMGSSLTIKSAPGEGAEFSFEVDLVQ